MKINWIDYDKKDHVVAWLILTAVSEAGVEKLGKNFDSRELEVDLIVNGVKFDIIVACEQLQAQLDRIEKIGYDKGKYDAISLIKENINNIFNIEE